jgi:hypothetical protein
LPTQSLHFLSGLPRSGSTVLAAILNQNPNTHVSTTSGLVHALDGLANTWQNAPLLNDSDPKRKKLEHAMRVVATSFYAQETNKPVVIDKSRGWPVPVIIRSMAQVLGCQPKIIATVRSVPDCAASFVRVAKPDNLTAFVEKGELFTHLKAAYQTLEAGYRAFPECFLFVEYEDLLANPKRELDRIHAFLDLPPFDYDLDHIDGSSVKENDEFIHGYAGMHDIKPKLARQHNQSAKDVLGYHYSQFCHPEFWRDKPTTLPQIDDLDLQLSASVTGNFAEGQRIADKLAVERPDDSRAAYNRGWYELMKGNIQLGYRLQQLGRRVKIIGDAPPNTPQPLWNGQVGTVLLRLEGGLGDQIHQARYTANLVERGCKVVLSSSGSLCALLKDIAGVSAVIQHGAEFGVYHDYWLPAMSAPVPLGLELSDIVGTPYVPRPKVSHKGLTIGLRWSGNKQFEREHHKLFPPALFFDAVKRDGVRFISLQRDADLDAKPDWVETVPLDSWTDTQRAVSSCDLVVSSCTSVSHLSAAMGVPTWVVIPVMGYYLYAEPGPKTPYYNSMRLFRQQKYGDWTHPFEEIKSLNYSHELLLR